MIKKEKKNKKSGRSPTHKAKHKQETLHEEKELKTSIDISSLKDTLSKTTLSVDSSLDEEKSSELRLSKSNDFVKRRLSKHSDETMYIFNTHMSDNEALLESTEDIEDDEGFQFDVEEESILDNQFIQRETGLLSYFESESFYDCIIDIPSIQKSVKAHRIVLSNGSQYFYRIFVDVGAEIAKISIPWDDDCGCIYDIIQWCYSGNISLNHQNCVVMSAMAERLEAKILQIYCKDFIYRILKRENAVDILLEAEKYKAVNFINRSISNVARNFSQIESGNINRLSYDLLTKVLSHKKLSVIDEYELYTTICSYVDKKKESLTESMILNIMSYIRFRWFSMDQLYEASINPLVPKSLIIEATMARIAEYEVPQVEVQKRAALYPLRLKKRPKFLMSFDYDKHDTEFFKGIIGWIATCGNKKEWKNPHNTGKVKVHTSSVGKGSRATLVDISPADFWTSDVPSSWISIDFGPQRHICPTHYSLRHGGNYNGDFLRTWDLQGSVDGISWKTIKRHTNDEKLDSPYAVSTWKLPGITESFRFFRVFQSSRNSTKHNFLVLSGFEFFGLLDDSGL